MSTSLPLIAEKKFWMNNEIFDRNMRGMFTIQSTYMIHFAATLSYHYLYIYMYTILRKPHTCLIHKNESKVKPDFLVLRFINVMN